MCHSPLFITGNDSVFKNNKLSFTNNLMMYIRLELGIIFTDIFLVIEVVCQFQIRSCYLIHTKLFNYYLFNSYENIYLIHTKILLFN